ncbi:MAG: YtxH domain-containing protein [Sporolactobacillus sp.]
MNEKGQCGCGGECGKLSASALFIGGLIGGVTGAVMALLLAPKSGAELRSSFDVQAAVRAGAGKARQVAADVKERVEKSLYKEDEPFS